MDLGPPKDIDLDCPSCEGRIETIHPHYTAAEHWMYIHSRDQWTWWILIAVLFAIWWPLGLLGAVVLYLAQLSNSKNKKLYKCGSCGTEYSYNELRKDASGQNT